MAEYKITRISQEAPKEHFNEKYNSTTYYIKAMVEGHVKPVSVGKRSPDALKVGDIIRGTITTTEYDTDNFKADPLPRAGGEFTPRDQDSIRAQWALRTATDLFLGLGLKLDKGEEIKDWIRERSVWYYKTVEEVKKHAAAEQVKAVFSDGSPVPDEVHDIGDEPISLDDIPF